jgi:hypothetical protein
MSFCSLHRDARFRGIGAIVQSWERGHPGHRGLHLRGLHLRGFHLRGFHPRLSKYGHCVAGGKTTLWW